jgi:hypothetical protein
MIMDILLQSNLMEKSYSVVIAITEAMTISASLVLNNRFLPEFSCGFWGVLDNLYLSKI